jgi:hypothetical protein
MSEPLYSVGTWDTEVQAYTPQYGLAKSFNLSRSELRQAIRELRKCSYSAHRRRGPDGEHDDNDTMVLIERTDGAPESEILDNWRR